MGMLPINGKVDSALDDGVDRTRVAGIDAQLAEMHGESNTSEELGDATRFGGARL